MIITRTPFRISFFGGGSDYPDWYNTHGGAVLASTIDKYCYISCRRIPPFFDYRHSIVYSKREQVNSIDEIKHPAVREAFRFMDVRDGLEINHSADLPARAGLGSSSAFTVGLLHALHGAQGRIVSKMQLALDAIHVEQEMIREHVGSQDQVITACGGLNVIRFSSGGIEARPLTLPRERLKLLNDHLQLFFTGTTRTASHVAEAQISGLQSMKSEITAMQQMVEQSCAILQQDGDLADFGRLLHESWMIKKSLTDRITTTQVDAIYDTALAHGAIGGKLLGAGGGGFVLFFVRPEDQDRLKSGLKGLLHVPFAFEHSGSHIVYFAEGEF